MEVLFYTFNGLLFCLWPFGLWPSIVYYVLYKYKPTVDTGYRYIDAKSSLYAVSYALIGYSTANITELQCAQPHYRYVT